MDGIFIVNKPRGISSAKAVYRIRRWTRIKKSGHAGTLDPAADGVLLVCQGRATKLVERCMDLPKTYHAAVRLDITSPTYDAEAETTPVPVDRIPDRSALESLLADRFTGSIDQTPPAFSAVKIKGRSAYKLARKGLDVQLSPRPVTIYEFRIARFDYPRMQFTVACSRGTYIRSLIRDIGLAIGTGGCLTDLTRTAIGPFTLQQALALDQIDQHDPEIAILPINAFHHAVTTFLAQNPQFATD